MTFKDALKIFINDATILFKGIVYVKVLIFFNYKIELLLLNYVVITVIYPSIMKFRRVFTAISFVTIYSIYDVGRTCFW